MMIILINLNQTYMCPNSKLKMVFITKLTIFHDSTCYYHIYLFNFLFCFSHFLIQKQYFLIYVGTVCSITNQCFKCRPKLIISNVFFELRFILKFSAKIQGKKEYWREKVSFHKEFQSIGIGGVNTKHGD